MSLRNVESARSPRYNDKQDSASPLLSNGIGEQKLHTGRCTRIKKGISRRARVILRPPVILGLLCLVVLSIGVSVIVWQATAYHLPRSAHYRNPVSLWRAANLHLSPSTPRITIVQHFDYEHSKLQLTDPRRLQDLSREQHERYANFWGYGYRAIERGAAPKGEKPRQASMNKLYAVMEVALQELGKGEEGTQWIMMTDADNLIVDPSIPLHSLIPSDTARSPSGENAPFIVGSEDANGFNAGNVIFRCTPDLIAFLSHTFALADTITKSYNQATATLGYRVKEGKDSIIETPPSDQRAMCLLLGKEEHTYYSSRFWYYPQRWFNWYSPPPRNPPSGPGSGGGDGIIENGVEGIQWHSHLAHTRKNHWRFDEYVEAEWIKWNQLIGMSTAELEERAEQVKRVADGWWAQARIGAPACMWV